MAIDFSSLGATPAHTGKIDFSAIGGVPAVGQDEPIDDTTALGAAGRGAVGMLPLGNQAYSAVAAATQKEPYLQERQELEKEIAADKENHEPSRLAGQAAGIAAPALLTGGASAPESLLGAAGQGAAIGAGFGAGNAIDTLASGGSGAKAAGDVALGAGLGAAGGAIGQKLAGALGGGAETLENFGVKKAAEATNVGAKELGNMSEPEFAQFQQTVNKYNLLGKDPQEMFNKAEVLQNNFGSKIGEIRGTAVADQLKIDPEILTSPLMEKYDALADFSDPDAVKLANTYRNGASTIQAAAQRNGGDLTFDDLSRIKTVYGDLAFDNGAVKNKAAADVWGSAKDGLQRITDEAQNNPNLGQEYKDALKGYSEITPIVDGLQKRVGLARSGSGNTNSATNTALGASMIATGRTAFGTRGLIRGALEMNPETEARYANAAAGGLRKVGDVIPAMGAQLGGANAPEMKSDPTDIATLLNHPALAQYRPDFIKNAASATTEAEKQTANARTDFTKSQNTPGYAEAKEKARGESQNANY